MSDHQTTPALADLMGARCREDWETAVAILSENEMPGTAAILAQMMQLVFGDAEDE